MNLRSPKIVFAMLILVSFFQLARVFDVAAVRNDQTPNKLPEFTQTDASAWINSAPLSRNDLKGKVVLLDFWTFDCWNCYRSFPWLNALEAKYAEKGLQVIGIHTPEFAHEKIYANVLAKTKSFGLKHPVMLDNDFAFWKSMHNRYWPTYYLIDKEGTIRGHFIGETHQGDQRAQQVEAAIKQLLDE